MAAIHVTGLTKIYSTYKKQPGLKGALRGLFKRETVETTAVQDVTFSVEEGELLGFLGPNGAGKTTTLKMLAGLLFPSRGTAQVLGYTPWERHDQYRRQFALLLGQKNQLWWDLPARESLALNAKIYGIPDDTWTKTVDEMTSLLDVGDKLNVMVRELSLGERMKFELIAALIHQPKILFLDEPTIGLDVVSQKNVREFLKHHNQTRKTTIILTSHYMADIQELCPRVIIIDEGRLSFDGQLDEILDRFADTKNITVQTETPVTEIPPSLTSFGEWNLSDPHQLQLKAKRDQVIPACKTILDELPVKDLDIQEVPIEDIIRKLFDKPHKQA